MKVSRSEFIKGFELLGFLGLLVALVVVPGQWLSDAVRSEAVAGITVSLLCVLAAVLLARSLRPVLVVTAQLLLFGGSFYLAILPFVAAETGTDHWQRLCFLGLVSAVSAISGWYFLQWLKPE
jgi:hypothetical protein